ncbi:hypothetical protein ACFV3R_32435 [Streptomyces sp. NPDC059740]|uniref:hypothetical protein n=1 Tax=Streptomyces sp. NPDC059740 TaxID=3346926 RepID=UPI003655EB5B
MTGLAPRARPEEGTDAVEGEAAPRARWARGAAGALAAFAGVRLLGLVVLALWPSRRGGDWHTLLSARWDSLWYARIATDGYGNAVRMPNGDLHSDFAFFPLLPWLERAVSALTSLPAADAGLAVSWAASLAAALALYAVGARLHGRAAGVLLAALWAALPVGVVQSMAYSESLFTALAAWSGYALLTRRWVGAGVLASLSGLARPVGAAVVAAVWLTAAVAWWRERAEDGPRPPGGRWESRRMLLGVLLAPLGWCAYFVRVGLHTGSVTGYLDVQAGWRNGFDGGLAFASFTVAQPWPAALALVLGVAAVVALFVWCMRRREPLPLLTYAGVVLFLALTAKGYFGSKPRLMMPAFPLLLPPAALMARWRPALSATVLGVLAAGSAVYGAIWLHGSGPP